MATQYCGDEYDHGQRHDRITMCTARHEVRCVVLNVRAGAVKRMQESIAQRYPRFRNYIRAVQRYC
jgi:hypothetical protein